MHMLVVPDSTHGLQSLWSLILCHVAFWGPTMCPTVFTSSSHTRTTTTTHHTHPHTHHARLRAHCDHTQHVRVSGVVEEYGARPTHRIDRTFGASVNRLTRIARGTYQSQG